MYQHYSVKLKSTETRGWLKIHSPLIVVVEVWKQTGGVRLDFRLAGVSQEAPHSQGRAMGRATFIVLGFPEQGFVLSPGFTAFAANECPFYNYDTPQSASPFPYVLLRGRCFFNFTQGTQSRHFSVFLFRVAPR